MKDKGKEQSLVSKVSAGIAIAFYIPAFCSAISLGMLTLCGTIVMIGNAIAMRSCHNTLNCDTSKYHWFPFGNVEMAFYWTMLEVMVGFLALAAPFAYIHSLEEHYSRWNSRYGHNDKSEKKEYPALLQSFYDVFKGPEEDLSDTVPDKHYAPYDTNAPHLHSS